MLIMSVMEARIMAPMASQDNDVIHNCSLLIMYSDSKSSTNRVVGGRYVVEFMRSHRQERTHARMHTHTCSTPTCRLVGAFTPQQAS